MIDIVILSGGASAEREISIFSTNEIVKNIDKTKYNARVIEIPLNGGQLWVKEILNHPPQLVLSALHGGMGEDGRIQGLLECLNIPYVGSKVLSSSICMDKDMCKLILKASHIPIIDGFLLKKDESFIDYEKSLEMLGYPLVLKPNCGGSSLGVNIVKNWKDLEKAMKIVKKFDDDILIEKYIDGHEVTCGIVETKAGLTVLPVLDISAKEDFYNYDAKYFNKDIKIEFSTLPIFIQNMIGDIAKKAFIALKCKGYARLDLIIKEEQIYVLEMNTLPGLTDHSLIPKAALVNGMEFKDFLDILIEFELENI